MFFDVCLFFLAVWARVWLGGGMCACFLLLFGRAGERAYVFAVFVRGVVFLFFTLWAGTVFFVIVWAVACFFSVWAGDGSSLTYRSAWLGLKSKKNIRVPAIPCIRFWLDYQA